MDRWWEDELGHRLEALSARIERDYPRAAHVDHRTVSDALIRWTSVTSRTGRGVPFTWTDLGDELQLEVGELGLGGRFELDRTAEDVAFIEQVVEAALAGRVVEIAGRGRSRVEVTLGDGEVLTETGYRGCLPIPGWVRRGRRRQFEPYRPE